MIAFIAPTNALACATCMIGDPTLTTMGAEQPFAERLRMAAEFKHRTDTVGATGQGQTSLSEQRLAFSVAYAPLDWLMMSAQLPVLWRTVEYENLAKDNHFGLGDLELRARLVFFEDRELAPRHLIAAIVGSRLPTAPIRTSDDGQRAPPELQPGAGAIAPFVGFSYSGFAGDWSGFVSSTLIYPQEYGDGNQASLSLSTTAMLQLQPWRMLGFRLGIDTRLDGTAQENGAPEPDSGGFIAFLTPGLVLSPVTDLVINAAVYIPTLNLLDGYHKEGPSIALGVSYDL